MLFNSWLTTYWVRLVAGLLAGAFALHGHAQNFPNKALTIVVAYPAGGASDFSARVMSKEMSPLLNQPIMVENLLGVGGSLGTAKVIAAAPDGYTLLLSSPIETILTPMAYSSVKYKPEDLKTVALLGKTSLMLVTRKDLGANTVEELIALAKKADKPLSYCTPGIGSNYHMVTERFAQIGGFKTIHAPYSGFPQCITNMVGGQIDFAFFPIAATFPGFVDSGSLKGLAVTGATPSARMAKLPTMTSVKGFEGYVFDVWAAIHVSSKVPDSVVAILNKAALATVAKDEVRKVFEQTGATMVAPMSAEQAEAFYKQEVANYQAMAKSINLQPQ